jgi:hypothetical protein
MPPRSRRLPEEANLSRLPEEANLSKLRDLPRAEAIRIAMIKYGWDAATAAKRVDIERDKPGQDR